MAHDPNSGLTCLDLDGGLVHHIRTDFHTCLKCQDTTTCITAAQCERDAAIAAGPVEEGQYARREAEWKIHADAERFENMGRVCTSMVLNALRRAFNAGWKARKKAEYEMAFGLDKPKAE